jgi:hypothetical protein
MYLLAKAEADNREIHLGTTLIGSRFFGMTRLLYHGMFGPKREAVLRF